MSRPSIQLSFGSPSDDGSLVIKLLIVSERFIFDEYSPSFVYSERGFNVGWFDPDELEDRSVARSESGAYR